MTLDEAIKHAQERANSDCTECSKEHQQLVDWLTEYKHIRDFDSVLDVVYGKLYDADSLVEQWAKNIKRYCKIRNGICEGCIFYKSFNITGYIIYNKCSLNNKPKNW